MNPCAIPLFEGVGFLPAFLYPGSQTVIGLIEGGARDGTWVEVRCDNDKWTARHPATGKAGSAADTEEDALRSLLAIMED